jgi:sugar O-acyltransferase (sialic acid O-acetyltransferase NeuD family)
MGIKMRLCIIGDGGLAREVAQTAIWWGYTEVVHVVCEPKNRTTKSWDWFVKAKFDACTVAVGDPTLKKFLVHKANEFFKNSNLPWKTLIHPNALVGQDCQIAPGAIIQAGAIITTNVKIEAFVLVNISSTIGHDSVVGAYSTINPGCNISGNVNLGEGCFVGTGAKILEKKNICDYSIIGAAALVNKNIKKPGTYIGIPAKELERK